MGVLNDYNRKKSVRGFGDYSPPLTNRTADSPPPPLPYRPHKPYSQAQHVTRATSTHGTLVTTHTIKRGRPCARVGCGVIGVCGVKHILLGLHRFVFGFGAFVCYTIGDEYIIVYVVLMLRRCTMTKR